MHLTPALRYRAAAALGAAAYLVYSHKSKNNGPQHAAFDEKEAGSSVPNPVRNAGPDAMRSDPPRWDAVDEASDESFPASDPPATY